MLPSLSLLEQIPQQILKISNQQGEYKRQIHHGLFLLCQKAGLRVSEAINFDLSARIKKGLYRITKTKGKKQRFVYIPKQVINELKANNWRPNSTNRFNFYHFLKSIKKELEIPANIELTPHTLRRAFATYHAENGLPLPLLQKLLGHSSIKTTALYWMNIYNEDNDNNDILTAKIWPKKSPWKPKLESEALVRSNLNELPELAENLSQSLANEPPSNYLTKIKHLEQQFSQIQKENSNLKSENSDLRQDLNNLNEQNALLRQEKAHETTKQEQIQQELTTAKETIAQLTQELATSENNLTQEQQINHNLCQQLQTKQENNQSLQETNTNLTQKLSSREQNHANLQNAYQIALKDKERVELFAKKETQRANHHEQQLKTIAKTLYQWQKINYYQQLEQQAKTEAKIIQVERPPPWKPK